MTGRYVNGFKVDFYWPAPRLWSSRRTACGITARPRSRRSDRIRDQAHAAAGLTTLRFTRAQVRFDPEHVIATLSAVVRRLESTS